MAGHCYAECQILALYAECLNAECLYAYCRYAECRGAKVLITLQPL